LFTHASNCSTNSQRNGNRIMVNQQQRSCRAERKYAYTIFSKYTTMETSRLILYCLVVQYYCFPKKHSHT